MGHGWKSRFDARMDMVQAGAAGFTRSERIDRHDSR
jgi:hypothetical protein